MLYYKYRSSSNLDFIEDILKNRRMYASPFKNLNDPLEGMYIYEPSKLHQSLVQALSDMKKAYKLLCLSETKNNVMMWSHYAEGHQGVAIGVSFAPKPHPQPEKVNYVDMIRIPHDICVVDYNLAKSLLNNKLKFWEYENEHRVFVKDHDYVDVELKELIFGVNASPKTKQDIEKIAREFCPEIKISYMESSELEVSDGKKLKEYLEIDD